MLYCSWIQKFTHNLKFHLQKNALKMSEFIKRYRLLRIHNWRTMTDRFNVRLNGRFCTGFLSMTPYLWHIITLNAQDQKVYYLDTQRKRWIVTNQTFPTKKHLPTPDISNISMKLLLTRPVRCSWNKYTR